MDDRLKIIVQTAIDKNSKQNLDDKLSKLKLKPLQLNVTLAKTVANTINSQLKELKIKAFSIPIDVQKKSIKQAVKGITDEMSGTSISKSLDSTLKKINTFRTQLANIQQSSFGLSHPIIDPKNQEKLSVAYKNIDDAINQVMKSGQQMTAQQEINIRKQISDVERLRKAYVQSERGALALEQKPITFDIEKATANLSALEAKWRNQGIYTGQFEENIERIKVALSKVDDQEGISKINQEIGLAKIKAQELNTELRKFNATVAQSTSQNKVISFLNANPKAFAANKKGFEDLIALIPKITNQAALTAFNKQFAEVTSTIEALGKKGNTVFKSLLQNSQKFFGWLIASGSIMSLIGMFKKMIDHVIDLDTQMTALRKVTDETSETYARFFDGAADSAQKLGTTMSVLIKSTGDFARLGYGLEDAKALAEVANIYQNVGDIDISSATESIISTLRAFNIEATNSIEIVDKFNEVNKPAPLRLVA